ncbi:MTH938/NDUFAF3 family protein [Calditrichota bacterium]
MKPRFNHTEFGSITIDNQVYDHDVIIRLNGEIKKRKKKLSKAVYGTSHVISVDEAKYVYEKGAKLLIFGAGQYNTAKFSNEATAFFEKKNCKVIVLSTKDATEIWNKSDEKKRIGLFHLTC